MAVRNLRKAKAFSQENMRRKAEAFYRDYRSLLTTS